VPPTDTSSSFPSATPSIFPTVALQLAPPITTLPSIIENDEDEEYYYSYEGGKGGKGGKGGSKKKRNTGLPTLSFSPSAPISSVEITEDNPSAARETLVPPAPAPVAIASGSSFWE